MALSKVSFEQDAGHGDEVVFRDDSNEAFLVNHRQAPNLILPHDLDRLERRRIRRDGDRIRAHDVLDGNLATIARTDALPDETKKRSVGHETDQLTGADRDHIFVSRVDAERLELRQDDPVRLESTYGTYDGRAFIADVAPGTLQGHWPEVTVLIGSGVVDAEGGVPDYNARVRLRAR